MTDARKLAEIDRGDAVNTARLVMSNPEDRPGITARGIRTLAAWVLRMDEALRNIHDGTGYVPVRSAPNVDGRDFYELCQEYRHSKEIMPHPSLPNTVRAFDNLRDYIKTGKLPWLSYEDDTPISHAHQSTKEKS